VICLFNIGLKMKNVLNAPEVYKLTQWIDQNPIPVQTMTQSELALLATSNLRFTVTSANCIMAGKNLGIQVGKLNYVNKPKNNDEQIKLLANAVIDLYERVGLLLSEDVKALGRD